MKVQHLGFNITEISERIAGVDVNEDGTMRIVFVVGAQWDEKLSPWITPEDAQALITALTEALRINGGGIGE